MARFIIIILTVLGTSLPAWAETRNPVAVHFTTGQRAPIIVWADGPGPDSVQVTYDPDRLPAEFQDFLKTEHSEMRMLVHAAQGSYKSAELKPNADGLYVFDIRPRGNLWMLRPIVKKDDGRVFSDAGGYAGLYGSWSIRHNGDALALQEELGLGAPAKQGAVVLVSTTQGSGNQMQHRREFPDGSLRIYFEEGFVGNARPVTDAEPRGFQVRWDSEGRIISATESEQRGEVVPLADVVAAAIRDINARFEARCDVK